MTLKKLGLTSAVMLATSSMAFAADDLQINGFINVTAGLVDNEAIQDSPAAVGYDTTLGFDPQTLAGLQISKKVNDNTSATVQLMSRGSQSYKTEAAWAFVTYELSENTDIRFGRLRTPMFHYSDFLEVGYAYNWISPPGIVYRLDSMSAMTGVDMTHRFVLGAMDGSLQLYTGRYKDDFNLNNDEYEMELQSAAGAVLSLNAGDFGTRLSYHRAELYINGLEGVDLSQPFNPEQVRFLDLLMGFTSTYDQVAGTNISKDVEPQGQESQFLQGSIFWDNGSTSLIAEYTALRHDSALLNDDDAWMVSAAQRFGDFTVHATYAMAEDNIKSGSIGLAQKFTEMKQSSATLGLRYDYNSSTAFKVEASYITHETPDQRLMGALGALNGGIAALEQASNIALDKATGSLYTVGMSIVF